MNAPDNSLKKKSLKKYIYENRWKIPFSTLYYVYYVGIRLPVNSWDSAKQLYMISFQGHHTTSFIAKEPLRFYLVNCYRVLSKINSSSVLFFKYYYYFLFITVWECDTMVPHPTTIVIRRVTWCHRPWEVVKLHGPRAAMNTWRSFYSKCFTLFFFLFSEIAFFKF